ncbi:MAG: lipopolysaccharide heptosyltransferase II [Candidatus Omnitrophica bacterium]|nr:lipopolysaccharide heptosyltransferase II [Candidatus Omnitrophota bacterium]MDD5592416.1 lipopolysaccharide heptosyltransferase II [Candidatus Omnitrophota bacterium]
MINKILFITLSNIGDCILTLPVLDTLLQEFPQAKITVLSGPRPKEIFQDNPRIQKLFIYEKHSSLREKISLFKELKKINFDLVVDLRNSLLGVALTGRKEALPSLSMPGQIRHMKDKHLRQVSGVPAKNIGGSAKHFGGRCQVSGKIKGDSLYIKPEDEEYIKNILRKNNITAQDKIIIIAPGARSHTKRWDKEKFTELIPHLIKEFGVKVALVGDKDDAYITRYITENCRCSVLDLSAKTTLGQLACLLKKAKAVITNDSAVLHLASYLNLPIVAIFGPTNEAKYGPWSEISAVVKKDIFCRPCEKAQCRFGTLKCLQLIKVEDVLRQVRNLLVTSHKSQVTSQKYKRILIVRTDRIGDVLLSTPAIKALRDNYPSAYIAMMVNPYAKDILEGNPYIDEVILYDKDIKHKSWHRSLRFALNLKKKKFDLAIVLHPANRVHLIAFIAGIPQRIGYNRKLGFLLTDRIKHTKQSGQKHESEYILDLVRYLGIEPKDKNLLMPLKPESENWAEELLRQEGIKKTDQLLAIHPAASCPSKVWPNERFSEVADRLIAKYGFKVLVVAGPKDIKIAQEVIKKISHPAINLAGKASVSQLASILKRCRLFISNDSGPVHIASALGTPVISIFGRNQKGLSPLRWGPLGKKDKFLHKDAGCIECLAHNCLKGFACLKAISVDDVVNATDEILKE